MNYTTKCGQTELEYVGCHYKMSSSHTRTHTHKLIQSTTYTHR